MVSLKVDVYVVVSRAVEEGARRGEARARKYADGPPDAEAIVDHVAREVMSALTEVVDFDGPVQDDTARDGAIRALCDFAEQPHPGRAGEAIDALERHLR